MYRWAGVTGLVLGALAFTFAGCSKDAPTDTNTTDEAACDPLAAPTIDLTGLVGVGAASDGTLYPLALPTPTTPRVFIAEGSSLVRQRIDGSGSEAVD